MDRKGQTASQSIFSDWVKSPFDRLNKPTNFESYAETCPVYEYDDLKSPNLYTKNGSKYSLGSKSLASQRNNLRSGSVSSVTSSNCSTPATSPLIRRKIHVSNFDMNALGPTSW